MWRWEVTLVDTKTGDEKKILGEEYSDRQIAYESLCAYLRRRLPDLYNGSDLLRIKKAEVIARPEGSEY